MAVLEGIRDGNRLTIRIGGFERRIDLPRDLGGQAKDAGRDLREELQTRLESASGSTGDALNGAASSVASAAGDAVSGAASAAGEAMNGATSSAGDAVARVGDSASKAAGDLGNEIGRAIGELKLDQRVEELARWIRNALPRDRMNEVVGRLERELPDTDKDRYDRAFERGRVRARSAFLGVGVLIGAAAGVAAAFLMDPERGAARREALAGRAKTLSDQAPKVGQQVRSAFERGRQAAADRGLPVPGTTPAARSGDTMVPVMDPAAIGETPAMPYAGSPITDPSSLEREPLDAPVGGEAIGARVPVEPLTTAAEEANAALTGAPRVTVGALDGDDGSARDPDPETTSPDDRGTWHRNL
jgi:hypothetical protein